MYKWINLVFYLGMVVVNGLSTFGKLNGGTTAEISKEFGSLITPVGWTFSIWGIIYALLLFMVIAPFVKPDGQSAEIGKSLAIWFPVTCALNIIWILSWHGKQIFVSWVVMIALFMTLYITFNKITNGGSLIGTEQSNMPMGLRLSTMGVSIYFGWICVALLANTMAMFVSLGLDGYGVMANVVTSAMLCIGAVLITLISMYSGNLAFTLAGIWGYVGILFRHISKTELDGQYMSIILVAFAGILIMAGGISIALSNKYFNTVKEV